MNIEPHADIRMMATQSYQFIVAYTEAGFTEEQAFQLVRDMLRAGFQANGEDNS